MLVERGINAPAFHSTQHITLAASTLALTLSACSTLRSSSTCSLVSKVVHNARNKRSTSFPPGVQAVDYSERRSPLAAQRRSPR